MRANESRAGDGGYDQPPILVANVAPTLQHADTLGLSATQIEMANSAYLLGQVVGALVFGHLTDRLGRKRLAVF